jgi:transcriptional regulator with XRE-family HTH domain
MVDNRLPIHARADLRRLTGLSLYELASETGIPRDKLIDWERGERLLYSETSLIIDALVCHSGKRLPELLRMHRRGLLTRRTLRPIRSTRHAFS